MKKGLIPRYLELSALHERHASNSLARFSEEEHRRAEIEWARRPETRELRPDTTGPKTKFGEAWAEYLIGLIP